MVRRQIFAQILTRTIRIKQSCHPTISRPTKLDCKWPWNAPIRLHMGFAMLIINCQYKRVFKQNYNYYKYFHSFMHSNTLLVSYRIYVSLSTDIPHYQQFKWNKITHLHTVLHTLGHTFVHIRLIAFIFLLLFYIVSFE